MFFENLVWFLGGVFVSYVFHVLSKATKEPIWSISSKTLIRGEKVQGEDLSNMPIEISYKGQKVPNLTVAKVVFWNKGNVPIKYEDVALGDQLRLEIADPAKFIDVDTIAKSDSSSKFKPTISQDRKEIQLDFDFIDRYSGIALQVTHTGTASQDISLKGKVIGCEIIRIEPENIITSNSRMAARQRATTSSIRYGTAFIALVLIGAGAYFAQSQPFINNFFFLNQIMFLVVAFSWVIAGITLLFLFSAVISYMYTVIRYQTQRLNKSLDIFKE